MENLKAYFSIGSKNIKEIVNNVSYEEIDVYSKLKQTEDKSFRLHAIISAWEKEQDLDRGLRNKYSLALICFFGFEIILASTLMILISFKIIDVKEWIVNVFFAGVFTQTSALVITVVKYLFPEIKIEFLKLIKNL